MALVVWAVGEHDGTSEILNWPYFFGWASALGSAISSIFILMEFRDPHANKPNKKNSPVIVGGAGYKSFYPDTYMSFDL